MRLFLLLTISATLWADAKTEADLRVKLATSEADLRVALHDKAALAAQLSALIKSNTALTQAIPTVAATQHASEKAAAVTQAQAESTQTLTNTDASVKAQTEFEKQLTRVEDDVKNIVLLQKSLTYLLIIVTILVISFTGVIVYSARAIRRPHKDCPEADEA